VASNKDMKNVAACVQLQRLITSTMQPMLAVSAGMRMSRSLPLCGWNLWHHVSGGSRVNGFLEHNLDFNCPNGVATIANGPVGSN
jgi:hypothetical protein